MKTIESLLAGVVVWLMAIVATGCGSRSYTDDPELRHALDRAGGNSSELEAVLDHYADEPEKLDAAKFLIKNMSGHYGYEGAELDTIESVLSPLMKKTLNFTVDSAAAKHWRLFSYTSLPRKDDRQTITADYLIRNIDHAYDRWKNRRWNASLPFEDFCELLLPYRVGDERLSDWRKAYSDRYESRLDSLYSGSDATEAARIVWRLMENDGWIYNDQLTSPHRDAVALLNTPVGYNRDWCDRMAFAMRACGIPVAIDMLLEAPGAASSHQWLVVRDNISGHYLPFGVDRMDPDRMNPAKVPRAKAKVYRTRFKRQNDRLDRLANIRSLPLRLNNAFIADVSEDYFAPNSVTVPVSDVDDGHIYLGLWVPSEWRIVDVGDMVGVDSARFVNIEPGVLFFPVKLESDRFTPCGDAFYLGHDGLCHILTPDMTAVEKVRLGRTFPIDKVALMRHSEDIIGGAFELSEDASFTNPVRFHEIKDTLYAKSLAVAVPESLSDSRYLRYYAPAKRRLSIGELTVYSDKAMTDTIQISVIDNVGAPYEPQYLNDGNPELLYTAPVDLHYVTVKVEGNSPIKMIELTPRPDRFYVEKGRTYELFYYKYGNGWVKVGEQVATDGPFVEFVVPANCLLMLHDKSSGSGGQVFIYRMRRQLYSRDISVELAK